MRHIIINEHSKKVINTSNYECPFITPIDSSQVTLQANSCK